LFSGAVNILFLASPLYLLQIYNRVIPSGSLSTLVVLSLVLLAALAAMVVLDALRSKILIRAAARLDRLLADRVFQAVVDLSMRAGASARNAQPLRDLDAFRQAMAGPAAQLFFDAPWTPLFIIVLFLINPLLGLIGLIGAGLLLFLGLMNDAATREGAGVTNEAANRSYGFTESVVRYADPAHAMGMVGALADRWRVDRTSMMTAQAAGSERHADFSAVIRFLRLVLQSSMLGVGAMLVVSGDMLPASIFAANLLLGRALAPLEQAIVGWRQLSQAVTAGKRVQTALNLSPPAKRRVKLPEADGHVELRAVSFTPTGSKSEALRAIDLDIAPGETVGVVGASGAGKSCLARLIVAASRPTEGQVLVGGLETSRWSAEALSRHVGYLPQNVGLFPGSIRDNICRFREASDRQVIEAAKRAHVHEMILELSDGYETQVHEGGAGISGGQRQRIGLARALFGSPKLLVLDEPNAHLDVGGEAALEGALKRLRSKGVTILLIAHRLGPLNQVDRVLMLENGRLELDGPRKAVMEQAPTELVHSFAGPGA
ncbi:MAG TPA: type I secretion system permease/ATPase, partial [Caulobacteraceae bacterium]